ncbi:BON domain-containing protein [Granulicella sp. L46]|jgi:hyperosmotically inducible periplasmic protein|uniref:BON domain-containing protein n=1 Tax=Granulicella sp. L46 TaxID=1641865 RepID=UPI00131C73C3|nr:BON domain-containing protein [Granulicella sp. L46]
MKATRSTVSACMLLAASLVIVPSYSFATVTQSTNQTAPDNSGQNKNQQSTADAQSNANSDLQTTAQIRKAIIADKSLSTYAHNVKIITVNGAVTLKGPVSSEDEKQKVASDATSVVSADKLTNELTVKQ